MLTLNKPYTSDHSKNRILIVDDDELVVNSFEKSLSQYENFIIDKTTNGNQALKLVNLNDYDIVITDIVMPELDGIQLLRQIKKLKPETEVILITAFSSYNSAVDAIHFGATDYLSKPFNPEELKIRILKAIKKRELIREKTEKAEEMERLSYTIAHDFKSILITIKAFIKILDEEFGTEIGNEGKYILDRIKINIENMENMVEGLLQYTRIGKLNVLWEDISTYNFIVDIVDNFKPLLNKKNIKLLLDENIPNVHFYREGLKQIFYNLIDNAIKYSREEVDSYIKIGTIPEYSKGGYIQFYIEDNGIGISKDKQKNIFDIFQRDTKIKSSGYGIGLAIVKRTLETAKCDIYVESEPDQYTVFFFKLPTAKRINKKKN